MLSISGGMGGGAVDIFNEKKISKYGAQGKAEDLVFEPISFRRT